MFDQKRKRRNYKKEIESDSIRRIGNVFNDFWNGTKKRNSKITNGFIFQTNIKLNNDWNIRKMFKHYRDSVLEMNEGSSIEY